MIAGRPGGAGSSLGIALSVGSLLIFLAWLVTLRRAPKAYLRENAASSEVIDGLTETFDGARTTEALRTGPRRIRRTDHDLHEQYRAERATLRLRTFFWPFVDLGFSLPVAATLFLGGWFYIQGWVPLEVVVTAVFYVQQLIDPIDRLLGWADEHKSCLARRQGKCPGLDQCHDCAWSPQGDG